MLSSIRRVCNSLQTQCLVCFYCLLELKKEPEDHSWEMGLGVLSGICSQGGGTGCCPTKQLRVGYAL